MTSTLRHFRFSEEMDNIIDSLQLAIDDNLTKTHIIRIALFELWEATEDGMNGKRIEELVEKYAMPGDRRTRVSRKPSSS